MSWIQKFFNGGLSIKNRTSLRDVAGKLRTVLGEQRQEICQRAIATLGICSGSGGTRKSLRWEFQASRDACEEEALLTNICPLHPPGEVLRSGKELSGTRLQQQHQCKGIA